MSTSRQILLAPTQYEQDKLNLDSSQKPKMCVSEPCQLEIKSEVYAFTFGVATPK